MTRAHGMIQGVMALALLAPWSHAGQPAAKTSPPPISWNDLMFVTPASRLQAPAPSSRPAVDAPLAASAAPRSALAAPSAFADLSRPVFAPPSGNLALPVIPNGCGSDTSLFNAKRVPQEVAGASFAKACDAHDVCYGTPWAAKAACDATFRADLLKSCATLSGGWDRFQCDLSANAYYQAVRLGGLEAFRQAQYQSLFNPTGPSLLGSPAPFTDRFSLLPGFVPPTRYHLMDINLSKPAASPSPSR